MGTPRAEMTRGEPAAAPRELPTEAETQPAPETPPAPEPPAVDTTAATAPPSATTIARPSQVVAAVKSTLAARRLALAEATSRLGQRARVPRIPRRQRAKPVRTRGQRLRRRVAIGLLVVVVLASVVPVINSSVGGWGADVLRAVLGPRLTAQVEAYYFDVTDGAQRLKVRVFGAPKTTPWAVSKATPLPTVVQVPTGPTTPRRNLLPTLMPLPPITPVIAPALPGEGRWITDGLPGPIHPQWPVPMAKTFLRPDPNRPYALVMLVAIDLRQAQLHVVDGTQEPAWGGPGVIAPADRQANSLLAAFNGGFKASDGHFGLTTDGRTYLPPQPGAATLALYDDGTVRMGAWGTASVPTAHLIAYRQNGVPLIDHGQINPLAQSAGYAWGAPILANIYTWRSAVALTSSNVLIYAAGNSVSAQKLAQTLLDAGAAEAMEMDINPLWVRFNTYSDDGSGLVAHKLRQDMIGWTNQFLVPYARDFIYVTRVVPSDWPLTAPNKPANG